MPSRTRRALGLFVLLSVAGAGAACGREHGSPLPEDSGVDTGGSADASVDTGLTTVESDDASTDTGLTTVGTTEAGTIDAGTNDADTIDDASVIVDAATCADLSATASALWDAAFAQALANTDCDADTQCELLMQSANCGDLCGGTVRTNLTGVGDFDASMSQELQVCDVFVADHCPTSTPVCPPGGSGLDYVSCLAGTCIYFPPAAWVELEVFAPSQEWTLTPDGKVVPHGFDAGLDAAATMASADLATVDGILRSATFRAQMMAPDASPVAPPTCAPPAAGNDYAFFQLLYFQGAGLGPEADSFDVSGCVFVGPAGNIDQQVYQLVTAY